MKSVTDESAISSAHANYALGVLFVVYVFNFVDRQLLSVFIGPIKQEFDVSDTAMGLLVGFAFALFNTFAGIPIARWADRGNRRNIIAIGLAVWSAMTVASGFAKTIVHLFVARIGVGIGEAAGTPPAHSMIADYFPLKRRATALAIYSSAVFVGAALAYLGGGYLREYFEWRTAFIIVGLPGLLFALVVRFTIREPSRGSSEQGLSNSGSSTLGETLRFLISSRCWVFLVTGCSLLSVASYGVLMWGYEFIRRVHGMPLVEIGQWMGLTIGLGGVLGTLIGGRLTDRWMEDQPAKSMWLPTLAALAAIPFGLVFFFADSDRYSLLAFFPFYLLLNVFIPMMYSVNQSLARLHMRATASAVLLFIANIAGGGIGPLVVGALSDFFARQHGDESIRYALASLMVSIVLGCILIVLSSRYVDDDLLRAREAE